MLKYNPVGRIQDILQSTAETTGQLPAVPALSNREQAIKFLTRQVFLGQPQPFGKRSQGGCLQAHHVQDLSKIGIVEKIGRFYHKGLVTVATRGSRIDVERVHAHVRAQTAHALAQPESELARDIQALLQGLALCTRAELAAAHSPSLLLALLRKEHGVQLSQLGTLMLPRGFISTLREPIHFVDTTGQKLGRLVELMCRA